MNKPTAKILRYILYWLCTVWCGFFINSRLAPLAPGQWWAVPYEITQYVLATFNLLLAIINICVVVVEAANKKDL